MHVQFSKMISHRPGVPFWCYVSFTVYLNPPVVINSDSFGPPCVDPRRDGGAEDWADLLHTVQTHPIQATMEAVGCQG